MSYYPTGYPPPAAVDPTAVTGKRVGAWLIDAVIYVALSGLLTFAIGGSEVKSYDLAELGGVSNGFCDSWERVNNGICFASGDSATTITNSGNSLWIFIGLFIAYCVVQGLLGGSLGKRAMGLRMVKKDGSLAGMGASFIRTLLWIVDAITLGIPIVGLITMLSTKGHRRVGDMGAGTYIVPASHVGHPVILPGETSYGQIPPGPMPGAQGYGYGQIPPQPFGAPHGSPADFPQQHSGPGQGPQYEADIPTWDPVRNAFIKYDAAQQSWLELDGDSQTWGPIST